MWTCRPDHLGSAVYRGASQATMGRRLPWGSCERHVCFSRSTVMPEAAALPFGAPGPAPPDALRGGCGVSKEECSASGLWSEHSRDSAFAWRAALPCPLLSSTFLTQGSMCSPVTCPCPLGKLWECGLDLLHAFALLGQVVSRPSLMARAFFNPCVAKISTSNKWKP